MGKKATNIKMTPMATPTRRGGDAGNFGKGYAGGVGGVGHSPQQTGEQVAYAVGVERALYYPEVGGPRPAAGNPLDSYAIPNGFDGSHKSDHCEGRQKRPELHARGKLEPRPRAEGNADPGRVQYCLNIVHPEGRGHGATKHYAN